MRLALVHARVITLELARHPAYVVPTLLFPSVFFLFFAAPGGTHDAAARMAGFAGFAAIGVAFFQFGVGIAVERESPWEAYQRTLPVGARVRLAARLLSALVFASAAAGLLIGVAVALTGPSLSPTRWLGLACSLLAGTVPFALLGIALGYWLPARGALPIANLLYLALAYGGGLWLRPRDLPDHVASASPYLPTRSLSDALVATATGRPVPWRAWLTLALFAAVFAVIARAGYVRDDGKRYN